MIQVGDLVIRDHVAFEVTGIYLGAFASESSYGIKRLDGFPKEASMEYKIPLEFIEVMKLYREVK